MCSYPGAQKSVRRESIKNFIIYYLWGMVKFHTGGIVRERHMVPSRCDSCTDSIVWMRKDMQLRKGILICSGFVAPKGAAFLLAVLPLF